MKYYIYNYNKGKTLCCYKNNRNSCSIPTKKDILLAKMQGLEFTLIFRPNKFPYFILVEEFLRNLSR